MAMRRPGSSETLDEPIVTGPYAQPWAAARHPVQGLQCLRCHTLQPPLPPGHYTCVACGAVLPLQRWVAHPPPGGPARRRRAPRASWEGGNGRYPGPPSYRGSPPRWGFPPAVWQGPVADPEPPNPARSLRGAATAAAIAAAVALLAAGAEIWRFVLMLDGRTQVLSGGAVRASDILVAASGLALVVAAVAVVALTVPALIRTSRFAAARLGRTPARGTRGLLLRLLVPGWNVYGAGQVAAEIDAMLGASSAAPRDPSRPGRLVLWWWASWVVNAAVLATAVLRGWGDSLQAIADTVELHIVLDVTAAVTSALLAALLLRFALLAIGRPATLGPWVVAPPSPTRGGAPAPSPAEQGGSSSTTGDAEGGTAAAPAPEDAGERAPQTREPAAH